MHTFFSQISARSDALHSQSTEICVFISAHFGGNSAFQRRVPGQLVDNFESPSYPFQTLCYTLMMMIMMMMMVIIIITLIITTIMTTELKTTYREVTVRNW